MGEESWQGHIMAASYDRETSYQLKQIDDFMDWRKQRNLVPCQNSFIGADLVLRAR